MKTFTINDIRSWKPCYNPSVYLPEDWEGTAVDLLNIEQIPFPDRLWCVFRTELISEKLMRLFAVWSYRQTLKFLPNQDPRSIEAANVAERFANGQATKEELASAAAAASSAASVSASADRAAADRAAYFASYYSSATASAAHSATHAAYYAANSNSANVVAHSAAKAAQKEKLIEMIKEENKL